MSLTNQSMVFLDFSMSQVWFVWTKIEIENLVLCASIYIHDEQN